MDTRPIDQLLQECADARYEEFLAAGHAASGCNGPYGCADTPVRNTGHWLVIYSYLWKITGDGRYREIALRFAGYLLEMQRQSGSGAIVCIDSGDDPLNGMIGQGWTIEALVYAYETFRDPAYLDCAVSVFRSQSFDAETGFWMQVEPDGTHRGFDYTLNHQVWFAVGGLLILEHREEPDIRSSVERHLAQVDREYFGVHGNGLIRHYGAMKRPRKPFSFLYLKQYVKYVGLKLKVFRPEQVDILVQEEGYHLFELFGYAQIRRIWKEYPLFRKASFQKALAYSRDIAGVNRRLGVEAPQTMNKYAYGYNSPAFEVPFIDLMFRGRAEEETVLSLLELQKKLCFDPETGRMDRNTADPETLTARLYEYVRFCDCCRAE